MNPTIQNTTSITIGIVRPRREPEPAGDETAAVTDDGDHREIVEEFPAGEHAGETGSDREREEHETARGQEVRRERLCRSLAGSPQPRGCRRALDG